MRNVLLAITFIQCTSYRIKISIMKLMNEDFMTLSHIHISRSGFNIYLKMSLKKKPS